MQARFVKGALLMGGLALVPYSGTAFAQPPPAAPASTSVAAPTTAPAARAVVVPAAAHGAVVVAVNDEAGPAAKALAHEVYREPSLRPAIDEATARALTGDTATAPPSTGSDAKLAEIVALRGSIATSVTDITTRHLLASLGASLHAEIVVAVSLDSGHAVARVLHTGTASFERVELGAGVEIADDGARSFRWPGAATTLRGFLPAPPAPPVVEAPKPVKKAEAPVKADPRAGLSDQRPAWKSPWFWAAIGGVAAVGITVFVVSKTTGSTPGTVHVDGTVAP